MNEQEYLKNLEKKQNLHYQNLKKNMPNTMILRKL